MWFLQVYKRGGGVRVLEALSFVSILQIKPLFALAHSGQHRV